MKIFFEIFLWLGFIGALSYFVLSALPVVLSSTHLAGRVSYVPLIVAGLFLAGIIWT